MGHSVLKKLSEDTGGRVISVDRKGDTAQAFQEIAEELPTQYFLAFTQANLPYDGSYHKIHPR
jgi:hypothetical protein